MIKIILIALIAILFLAFAAVPFILIRLFSTKDEIPPEVEKQMRECDQYSYDHLIDPDDQ